jgi:hypothetical protein
MSFASGGALRRGRNAPNSMMRPWAIETTRQMSRADGVENSVPSSPVFNAQNV